MKKYKCIKRFSVDLLDENENVEVEDGKVIETETIWYWDEEEDENDIRLTNDSEFLLIDEKALKRCFVEVE